MGNKTSNEGLNFDESKKDKIEPINRNSFDYISIIGRGGFGKVWNVMNKKTKKEYAMKEMCKAKIIDKKSDKSILSERDFLLKMHHPFIVNMHYSFQDKENLYLILDLLTGGDLRYHICKQRHFTEEQSKFIIACIILGLEYCHHNKIIHRDIKPENLVFDSKGYVKITDFGIAKLQKGDLSKETSGTPGYMAPEVMCSQDHTVAVDSFALGVIGYEFMHGRRPFLGKTRKEIKDKMLAKQVLIKSSEIPPEWSIEAADFINRLIRRKTWERLGEKGVKELKEHIWLKDFQWRELYLGKLVAPFIPKNEDNFDHKYCNATEKQGINTKERYQAIYISDKYSIGFVDYSYFNRQGDEESSNTKTNDFIYHNLHEDIYALEQLSQAQLQLQIKQLGNHNRQSSDMIIPVSNNAFHNRPISHQQHMHQRIGSMNNSASAFMAANQYVNKRHELKKNMSTVYMSKQNSLSNGNINSNNSTGFGFNSIKL